MSEDKKYHSLHANKIFMGGAADVEAMVKNEEIDIVVDLRGEATGCAYPEANVEWVRIPLGDEATENEDVLYKKAIDEVVTAYKNGKKVAFHCGGGKGRTGTVAAGVLLSLGECQTVDEAEQKAKSIRTEININPDRKESLLRIYP